MIFDLVVVGVDVIEHLHFDAGLVRRAEFGGFMDTEDDAAVAAGRNLPLEFELVIFVLTVGYDVAALLARNIGIEAQLTVFYYPRRGDGIAQIRVPAVGRFSIKKRYPAVIFSFRLRSRGILRRIVFLTGPACRQDYGC